MSDPKQSAATLPSMERIQQELASATSVDDFFGKEGIFARLFATTLEQMLDAELTAHLGYERYASEGRTSGNSRNGKRERKLRTSTGDVAMQVPRDRAGTFHSPLLADHQTSTNELEEKIIALYAKGVSTHDIQDTLRELYGVEVSPATISTVTDKVWSLVESWQNRPLAAVYPNRVSRCDSHQHAPRWDGAAYGGVQCVRCGPGRAAGRAGALGRRWRRGR